MYNTFFHRHGDEFLAFVDAGELRIPVHEKTGQALSLHQRARGGADDAAVQWRPASGCGTVLSFTVTRRPYTPEFPVPLLHGLIELAEGPQLICRLDGITPETVAVGQAVQAHFDRQGLVFRPAPDDGNKADRHN